MERHILEFVVRAAAIAVGTAALLRLMGVKSPSARHAAWTTVMFSMLLLPLWTAWGPKANFHVLPAIAQPIQHDVVASTSPVHANPNRMEPTVRAGSWSWRNTWIAIYLLGSLTLLLRLAIGTLRTRRLIRTATGRHAKLTHPSCAAPVTVGWLHPVVILPECWRNWSAAQLDAVMAHENEHARRRDPLVQWLALLNRALFWFHPLAWWLERRLSELAEEACDAVVLERGHDARDYSDYLLDIARSVVSAGSRIRFWDMPAVGMKMPGSALTQRIRMILDSAPAPRISRARLMCVAVACLTASCFFASVAFLAYAQTPPASPTFEVASVKQNKSGGMGASARGGSINFSGAEITITNCTLWKIIGVAYGFGEDKDYALTGPEWLKSERYDVVAKIPADMPKDRQQSYERLQLMMRSLLADRFKLPLHHEQKTLSAYALILAKGGSKMPEADPTSRGMNIGPASMKGPSPMSHFADLLSQKLDRPVVDLTELKGVFDIKLEWSPDENSPAEPPTDPSKPSIFTAIQEQLGLKLEARRVPVDVLVVDRAEKVPTAN